MRVTSLAARGHLLPLSSHGAEREEPFCIRSSFHEDSGILGDQPHDVTSVGFTSDANCQGLRSGGLTFTAQHAGLGSEHTAD